MTAEDVTSSRTSFFPAFPGNGRSIFPPQNGEHKNKQLWKSITINQGTTTGSAVTVVAAGADVVDNMRDVCVGNFDAVTSINDHVFIFKNQFVYRLDANLFPVHGYPIAISAQFPGVVELEQLHADGGVVDAAYQRQTDGAVVLFVGHRYWTFNGTDFRLLSSKTELDAVGDINNNRIDQRTTIWDLGLPNNVTRIDAVFVWPKNQRTYIFAGNSFWKSIADDDNQKDLWSGPWSVTRWHGIPFNIDGVMTLPRISTVFEARGGIGQKATLFFKSNSYWLYNDHWVRPEIGFPRLISSLFNCR